MINVINEKFKKIKWLIWLMKNLKKIRWLMWLIKKIKKNSMINVINQKN